MSTLLPGSSTEIIDENISQLADSLYFGFIVNTLMCGFIFLQSWNYYSSKNQDGMVVKYMVGTSIGIATATTCINVQIAHYYLISHFGNTTNLYITTVPFAVEFTLTGLVVYITQLYFAARIYFFLNVLNSSANWGLSKAKLISGAVVVISTLALGFGIASAIYQFQHSTGTELSSTRMKITIGLWHGLSGVSDLITTLFLVLNLNRHHTDVRRTNSTILRLMYYTITRGIFITALQLALVILFSIHTERLYWMAPHLCCNKFYVITLIAMLNSRQKLFEMHHRSGIVHSDQFMAAPNQNHVLNQMETQTVREHNIHAGYELQPVNTKDVSATALEVKVDIQVTSDIQNNVYR